MKMKIKLILALLTIVATSACTRIVGDTEARATQQKELLVYLSTKAVQGDAGAQYFLGLALSLGKGAKQDEVEALRWWRKAAERGDADAQYELGKAYYIGNDVAEDLVESAKWYRKAAEQGHSGAQYSLDDIKREKAAKDAEKLRTEKDL